MKKGHRERCPFVAAYQGMTRGEAFRETAGGVVGERDRFRPLREARWPEARPPRGRIRRRGNCCKCRTSPSLRSSNPYNVGRLEAALNPSILILRQYSRPVRCWSSPSAASEVSCRVRVERLPYSPARDSPQKGGSPVPTGFRHSQQGSNTSADNNCGFIITVAWLLVNVFCYLEAHWRNQKIDAVAPPSTWMVVPVICRAGSEARKTTRAATSSAVPI